MGYRIGGISAAIAGVIPGTLNLVSINRYVVQLKALSLVAGLNKVFITVPGVDRYADYPISCKMTFNQFVEVMNCQVYSNDQVVISFFSSKSMTLPSGLLEIVAARGGK